MQNQKESLINIISRCNCKKYKAKWILELVHNSDIECTESECTSCLIAEDCMAVCDNLYLGGNGGSCTADCKIDDSERCGGCQYA